MNTWDEDENDSNDNNNTGSNINWDEQTINEISQIDGKDYSEDDKDYQ